MTSISIFFRTWWQGRLVGTDAQGNRYYEDRKATRYGKPRRWVMYKGGAEASKIPPGWHGWLHYTASGPPEDRSPCVWEKAHLPNVTGTSRAHQPKGAQKTASGDYEPWTPGG